jgi:hypothetical protein
MNSPILLQNVKTFGILWQLSPRRVEAILTIEDKGFKRWYICNFMVSWSIQSVQFGIWVIFTKTYEPIWIWLYCLNWDKSWTVSGMLDLTHLHKLTEVPQFFLLQSSDLLSHWKGLEQAAQIYNTICTVTKSSLCLLSQLVISLFQLYAVWTW